MGFYPPSSLVRDAQRRGVEVRPPHVNLSAAKCALEGEAVRVGLEYVRSLGEEEAEAVVAERERAGPFFGVRELAQRTGLDRARLEVLVASGACDSFGGSRRALLWELGLVPQTQSVPGSGGEERQLALPLNPTAPAPALREQSPWERMLADYRLTSLSVGVHPLSLLRAQPLLLARGKFERLGRNRNVVVRVLESLTPLAGRRAKDADVVGALP